MHSALRDSIATACEAEGAAVQCVRVSGNGGAVCVRQQRCGVRAEAVPLCVCVCVRERHGAAGGALIACYGIHTALLGYSHLEER